MTRQNPNANDTDATETNQDASADGRTCGRCGDPSLGATLVDAVNGLARRDCGCLVAVVSTGDDGLRADGGTTSSTWTYASRARTAADLYETRPGETARTVAASRVEQADRVADREHDADDVDAEGQA